MTHPNSAPNPQAYAVQLTQLDSLVQSVVAERAPEFGPVVLAADAESVFISVRSQVPALNGELMYVYDDYELLRTADQPAADNPLSISKHRRPLEPLKREPLYNRIVSMEALFEFQGEHLNEEPTPSAVLVQTCLEALQQAGQADSVARGEANDEHAVGSQELAALIKLVGVVYPVAQ